jgi:TIR domain
MALTPSERLTLMKEIAQRLGNEEWPLVDATLKQFSLPRSDPEPWTSTSAYALRMIEDAADNTLVDLAYHLRFQLDQSGPPRIEPPRIEPPFWRKGMLRLFISHLATNRKLAAELQEALLIFGISAFVAHNDIEPTQEWETEIQTALATCEVLVALLNPGFHQSNWTDQEIGYAMGRDVPVCSVRFGEDPYGFIRRFQAFDGNGKTASQLARELFDAYRKHKETRARMAEIVVSLFEGSNSFARARSRMGYLEELETWDPSFSTRLQAALKNNSQVADAYGVPARITALIKKWETNRLQPANADNTRSGA